MREAHLAGADLTGTRLRRSNLQGLDLRGARLTDADLQTADLRDALLDRADLRGATLAEARGDGVSLVGANLTMSSLRSADFRSADFTQALLTDTDLSRCLLERANLQDADLIGAELAGADLRQTILCGANLREAHLDGTDFAGARFGFTVLAASDLSRARHLEEVVHDGPSTVGIDAFLLSRGEIPDRFLIGIGLSPLTIEYLKAVAAAEEGMLVGDALFLVFHPADRARARRLRAYLRMHRHQAWYWQQLDELAGRYNPELQHRVRFHDRLILLHSSVSRSDSEILATGRRGLALEAAEGRRIVYAVRLDEPAAAGDDWERTLRGRFLADFQGTRWDDPRDPVFRRELERMLQGLEP